MTMMNTVCRKVLMADGYVPANAPQNIADLYVVDAINAFVKINNGSVWSNVNDFTDSSRWSLLTNRDPEQLYYPEGWYFAKDCLRNKHNTTNGSYSEVPLWRIEN